MEETAKLKYVNRYGDEYEFAKVNETQYICTGPWSYCRFSMDDKKNYTFIDPSGGPFIGVSQNLHEELHRDLPNKNISKIDLTEEGVLISIETN